MKMSDYENLHQQQVDLPLFSFFLFRVTVAICWAVGSAPGVCEGSCLPWPKAGPPGVLREFCAPGLLAILSLISRVIVSNAMSTFCVAFADVSMNGIPNYDANSWPSSKVIWRRSSISHLFPTRILQTPACEYFSISLIQVRTLSKVSRSVTS